MLYIAICDDDEGVCAELERMLYDYAEQNKIQIDIDIWYRGESLCRFLREKEQIPDVLFLGFCFICCFCRRICRLSFYFRF